MARDPIVDEVHKIREKLLEEHGGFDGYFEHLLEVQAAMKDRVVRRPSRPPVKTVEKKIS